MNNFDLKKFLIENKLTQASKLSEDVDGDGFYHEKEAIEINSNDEFGDAMFEGETVWVNKGVTEVPDGIVAMNLDLQELSITKLPDNMEIENELWIGSLKVTEVPNGLRAEELNLHKDSPLLEKYPTEEDLENAINEKGGSVNYINIDSPIDLSAIKIKNK